MDATIGVHDLVSLAEYERVRTEQKRRAVALRKLRRVSLGGRVSVLFESRETVLFQIHETLRDGGITDQATLEAECEAYAALLPRPNELSATLMLVPPGDGNVRAELERLASLDEHLSLRVAEAQIRATVDPTAPPGDKASSVKYVRFRLSAAQRARFCDPAVPVAIFVDHPHYRAEGVVRGETRRLLVEDLS